MAFALSLTEVSSPRTSDDALRVSFASLDDDREFIAVFPSDTSLVVSWCVNAIFAFLDLGKLGTLASGPCRKVPSCAPLSRDRQLGPLTSLRSFPRSC